MSQGTKDKFLPIFFGSLGAVVVAFGYLGCSASSTADEAKARYDKKLSELDRLEKEELSRTDDNAKRKKELVDGYVTQVQELSKTLMSRQAEEKPVKGDTFQSDLKKAVDDVIAAAKARSVKIPEKFDFGMGNYLGGGFPVEGAAPKLRAQLDALAFLTNAAFAAGVTEVNSLVRPEQEYEKAKKEEPAAQPGDRRRPPQPRPGAGPASRTARAAAAPVLDESTVLERQPVQITVTGKNKALLTLLESLANTSPEKEAPHFFVIRTLRVENSNKDGIDKNREVTEREAPDPNDKEKAIKYDAEYMLGFEDIKMELDLDVVRFLPEPPAEEKTRPAARPAAPASN